MRVSNLKERFCTCRESSSRTARLQRLLTKALKLSREEEREEVL